MKYEEIKISDIDLSKLEVGKEYSVNVLGINVWVTLYNETGKYFFQGESDRIEIKYISTIIVPITDTPPLDVQKMAEKIFNNIQDHSDSIVINIIEQHLSEFSPYLKEAEPPFNESNVRKLLADYNNTKFSFGKMVDILNNMAGNKSHSDIALDKIKQEATVKEGKEVVEIVEEAWDEFSETIGESINDLDFYAGRTVMLRSSFIKSADKLLSSEYRKLSPLKEAEQKEVITDEMITRQCELYFISLCINQKSAYYPIKGFEAGAKWMRSQSPVRIAKVPSPPLTPLEDITEEDAIECVKILVPSVDITKGDVVKHFKTVILKYQPLRSDVYQYLQSRNYKLKKYY